jgi:hypothetical protein
MTGLENGEVLTDYRHPAFVAVAKQSTHHCAPETIGGEMSDKPTVLNGRHVGDG